MKRTDKEIKAAKIARAVITLRNAPHAKPNDVELTVPGQTIDGLPGWLRYAAWGNVKMR